MAKKHDSYSTLIVAKKMQIKTTVGPYTYTIMNI